MEIFEGTPKEKFFDIIFNANRNLVEEEIDNLLKRYAIISELCEQNGFKECETLNTSAYSGDTLDDLYIELTGNILSKNE
ncbi:MAG: DUF2018 family protein [Campylobacter sp.]|nr:DUF2018 family protein [Campylobacter sp.]